MNTLIPDIVDDVAHVIFRKLHARTLVRLRAVCKAWHQSCLGDITCASLEAEGLTIQSDDAVNRSILTTLTTLETLRFIDKDDLSQNTDFLTRLRALSHLSICSQPSPATWSALSHLTRLHCMGFHFYIEPSRMPPPTIREKMTSLRVLELSAEQYLGSERIDLPIEKLYFPTSLTALSIRDCSSPITDAALRPLVNLRALNIRCDSLAGSGLTDDGLTHLTALTELGISESRVTPNALTSLTRLVYLDFCYIRTIAPGSFTRDLIFRNVYEYLPSLYYLRMSYDLKEPYYVFTDAPPPENAPFFTFLAKDNRTSIRRANLQQYKEISELEDM